MIDACKPVLSYDGVNILQEASATTYHTYAKLGYYKNLAVVVGSRNTDYSSDNNQKSVEILSENSWLRLDDFPFVASYIYSYSMVTFENVLYLFGGYGDYTGQNSGPMNLAVTFEGPPYKWTIAGALLTPRRYHNTIVDGQSILHVGGEEQK